MFEFLIGPLAEALIHFLWQGTAIAAVIGIGLWLLQSARQRYGLVLLGLATCLCCIPATVAWLVWRDLRAAAPVPFDEEWLLAELAASTAIDLTRGSAEWSWRQFLVLGWTIGVGLCSLRLLLGGWGVVSLHRSLQAPPDAWEASIQRITGLFGWQQAPRVALSDRVGEPLALLWWRPVVVLPAAWALSIPPAVLESVLAHEFAHLYRWDLWINAGQRIVEACLFYHPAVWWLSSRLRRERELICDELAVSRLGQPLQYAQALEYVARARTSRPGVLFAASLGESRMDLLQRVKRVLGVPTSASPGRWWPAGVAALLVPAGIWLAGPGWTPAAVGDDDRREARDDDDRPEHRQLRELRHELERAHQRIQEQDREIRELREGHGHRPNGRPPGGPDLEGLPPEARERIQHHMTEMRELMQHHRREMAEHRERGEEHPGLPPEVQERIARHQAEMHEIMMQHQREGRGPEGGPRPPFGPGGPRPPFAEGRPGREGFQPPREVLSEVMEVVRDLRNEVNELRRELHELRERPHGDHPPHGGPRPPEFLHRPDGPPRDGMPPRIHRDGPPEGRGPGRDGPRPEARERRPDGEGPRREGPPPEARERGPEGRGPGRDGDRPEARERRPDGEGPRRDGPRPEARERGPEGRGPEREGPPRDRPRPPEGERKDGDRAAASEQEVPVAAVVKADQPLEAAPAPEATPAEAPASADTPVKDGNE